MSKDKQEVGPLPEVLQGSQANVCRLVSNFLPSCVRGGTGYIPCASLYGRRDRPKFRPRTVFVGLFLKKEGRAVNIWLKMVITNV